MESLLSNYAAAQGEARAEEEAGLHPWERGGWVPTTAFGRQKSPNVIREELARYIHASSETQTAIIDMLGVNSNAFRSFMNPKTYKDQWLACYNGTYLAAARLLEEEKFAKDQAKKYRAEEEAGLHPWERGGWVPTTAFGRQKSPNVIREELARYIHASSETQTAIIDMLGVNSNAFRSFMNPKTYKDQWLACYNGTYLAAARLLEEEKFAKDQAKKYAAALKKSTGGAKRKAAPADGAENVANAAASAAA